MTDARKTHAAVLYVLPRPASRDTLCSKAGRNWQLGLPEYPQFDDYLAHLDSALLAKSSTACMTSTLCTPWYLPPQA